MIRKQLTVTNPRGIHARPSSAIAMAAAEFSSSVTLTAGNRTADARNVLEVMMLAAAHNDVVTLTATGPDEQRAVEAVVDAFNSRFE